MSSLSSSRPGGKDRRFSSTVLLVLTILPMWVLWVYADVTLRVLERDLENLPRYYRMHLYREEALRWADEVARRVVRINRGRLPRIAQGQGGELTGEECERLASLSGPGRTFILVDTKGLRVLCPGGPAYGGISFLSEAGARGAFLRTVRRMAVTGSRGGYFSTGVSGAGEPPGRQSWFLAAADAGDALICIVPVPVGEIARSGEVFDEAQEAVLEQRRKRFERWSLPVLIVSSLCILILACRNGRASPAGSNKVGIQ